MEFKIVPLDGYYLQKMGVTDKQVKLAYLSPGSVSYCLLADGEPVFAGGVVDMKWKRGEAWMLPTQFFRDHVKTCFRYMKDMLPLMALNGNFKRIQATCAVTISTALFVHLGFKYEGTMMGFGPSGETCHMYARIFR